MKKAYISLAHVRAALQTSVNKNGEFIGVFAAMSDGNNVMLRWHQ